MLTCENCQMLLADSLYERLTANDQQGLDAHLASCAECRALQQELNESTAQLRTATATAHHCGEMPALDDLWSKLEPRLDRVDAQRYQRMANRGWRRLSGGALALAASLVLAVTVVFQGSSQRAEPVATPPSRLAARTTAPEFQNYLDRAQAVMLLLANADQNGISSIPLDRDYAGLMAVEARLLNASLGSQLSASEQKLLSDVEYLLMQFANIDDDNLDEGLAMLRLYLQDNTVLFRMNLARIKQPQVI